MKTILDPKDIADIATAVVEMLKPLLSSNSTDDKYMTIKEAVGRQVWTHEVTENQHYAR